MSWRTIPLADLRRAPWNYKLEDEGLLGKLRENMARNGQVINLIVRRLGDGWEVVNGNHRLEALRALGADDALCFDLGEVSDAYAKRVAIETNETTFPTDHEKLAAAIEAMSREFDLGDLARTVPYSDAELEGFVRMSGFDWATMRRGPGGSGKVGVSVPTETKEAIEARQRERGLESLSASVSSFLDDWEGTT